MSELSSMNLGASLNQASSYTDFNALAELRAKVTNGSSEKSAEATKEVAQQFESLFLQMMLKSMRDATYVDENSDNDQTRFYQEMFDKQIALDLSNRENGGIGLAKIMEQQMSGGINGGSQNKSDEDKPLGNLLGASPEASSTHSLDNTRQNFYASSLVQQFEKVSIELKTQTADLEKSHSALAVKDKENWSVNSAEEFTQTLWPYAKKAAEELGVKPEVLIAQAALETGWGDKMIKDSSGNNANNLFGIKADFRWQGERVTVSTLEFRDGIAAKEQASFRSYDSLEQSFDDYAKFLQNNSRYQNALEHTSNPNVFLDKLQQAGYSTDPNYSKKIQSIISRDSFVQTVNDLTMNNLSSHKNEESKADQQLASWSQSYSVSNTRGNR